MSHAPRDHCLAPQRSAQVAAAPGDRYGRLFPELPALACGERLVSALAAQDGPCGCPAEEESHGGTAAGWPFFGQFVAHDITADRSVLSLRGEPDGPRNFRAARANLESLYGEGPVGHPFLFSRSDPAKLLLTEGQADRVADLPRNAEGTALIIDPRNDVHAVMSQLHLAFARLHNRLVDRLREDGVPDAELFDEARRATVWHYQWILVRDYLPSLVGGALVGEILDGGPSVYRPGEHPAIPLEFADAAFRYGHCQVRDAYTLRPDGPRLRLFPDLLGFRPLTDDTEIDWAMLFDVPGRPAAQRAKRIDGTLPPSLMRLPGTIAGAVDRPAFRSLAARDAQRGETYGLPSGEAVARRLGLEPLDPAAVGLGRHGWTGETPLWFYVLREADVHGGGDRLGPVGGRLVAEVLIGIVAADPESYLALDPAWQPTLPARDPARFTIADVLVPLTA